MKIANKKGYSNCKNNYMSLLGCCMSLDVVCSANDPIVYINLIQNSLNLHN